MRSVSGIGTAIAEAYAKIPAETAKDRARFNNEMLINLAPNSRRDETGFGKVFRRCDSPIEQQFCLALFQVEGVRGAPTFHPRQLGPGPVYVVAQQELPLSKTYRVDFLLVGDNDEQVVIVECDGAYHDEPEQRAKDADRQREIERLRVRVLRFTGRQIYEDPRRVIADTLAACGRDPGLVRFRNVDMWSAFNSLRGWRTPVAEPEGFDEGYRAVYERLTEGVLIKGRR